jgi:WD40 repeat protein
VYSARYSPSGKWIVSVSVDKTVRLWNADTGECRYILTGHDDDVNRAAFSPHGDLVASVSNDKTVRVWDVESGQCRAVIQDITDYVKDIDWVQIPDAYLLVIGCQDGSVSLWEIIAEGDLHRARLRWGTMTNALTITDATIQDVQGLSHLNKQLLKQRGAVGEPDRGVYDGNKELTGMALAVSELKTTPNSTTDEGAMPAGISIE